MKRLAPLAVLLLFFAAACSGESDDRDAGAVGADAGVDAGGGDSGLFPTPCGAATCTPDQYCQIDPAGACTPSVSGNCAQGEEACQQGGDGGCTPTKMRVCRPLPEPCAAAAQCACMINQNLCPATVNASCGRPSGQGVTIECPFP